MGLYTKCEAAGASQRAIVGLRRRLERARASRLSLERRGEPDLATKMARKALSELEHRIEQDLRVLECAEPDAQDGMPAA